MCEVFSFKKKKKKIQRDSNLFKKRNLKYRQRAELWLN
jgi:hypothetical protein